MKNYYLKTCFIGILLILLTGSVIAQTSTVYIGNTRQIIRGFGGMNHPVWIGDLTESQRNTAFRNGAGEIGMTVLRIWISDNPNDWSREVATARRAIELGSIVIATPWNPPAEMCETVWRNNRNEKRLKPSSYGAFVNHLNSFNNFMKDNGVNLYAISFANEPDYGHDWTWYSIDEVYNFTKNYAGALRINGTKVITAESFAYNKPYYDNILNDPAALANIDVIGAHIYASDANTPDSFFQYPLADQKASGKERFMTEHYTSSNANSQDLWPDALNVGYEIHRCMVEGQFNAYVWWYIRRSYGPMREDGSISKRGYCMAQFSKFIRPGYVRIDASKNPTPGVYVSAYKYNNNLVIVAINRNSSSRNVTFNLSGGQVGSFTKYETTSNANLANRGNISAGSSMTNSLSGYSITTFVGTLSGTGSGPVVSGGTYRITPRHSSKAIDVENCGTGNGTNVRQWSWLNNNCQKFIFTSADAGYWRISPSNASGKALDVPNCSGSDNASIQLWDWYNNDCQKWELIDRGGGWYSIRSKTSGKCLDISGISTNDGADLIQWSCNSNAYNQQFRFESVSSAKMAANDPDNELPRMDDINVFPNPITDDMLNVRVPQIFDTDLLSRVQVYNNLGKLMHSENFKGAEISIDLKAMPRGIYIIKLDNGSRVISRKIVKQ